jgi:hypothetical protein
MSETAQEYYTKAKKQSEDASFNPKTYKEPKIIEQPRRKAETKKRRRMADLDQSVESGKLMIAIGKEAIKVGRKMMTPDYKPNPEDDQKLAKQLRPYLEMIHRFADDKESRTVKDDIDTYLNIEKGGKGYARTQEAVIPFEGGEPLKPSSYSMTKFEKRFLERVKEGIITDPLFKPLSFWNDKYRKRKLANQRKNKAVVIAERKSGVPAQGF